MVLVAGGLTTALSFLLLGCGGGEQDVLFDSANAKDVAYAVLPNVGAMPGGDWKVVSFHRKDKGNPEEDENDEEERLTSIEAEPACKGLKDRKVLAHLLIGGGTPDFVGGAHAKFERTSRESPIKSTIEMHVDIQDSVNQVNAEWKLAKSFMAQRDFDDCLAAVLVREFEKQESRAEMELTPVPPSGRAPRDGVALAFDMTVKVGSQVIGLDFESYSWPYGNAEVTVTFSGHAGTVDQDLVSAVLKSLDDKLVAVEANQQDP